MLSSLAPLGVDSPHALDIWCLTVPHASHWCLASLAEHPLSRTSRLEQLVLDMHLFDVIMLDIRSSMEAKSKLEVLNPHFSSN
jgi:hypothetical protein